MTVKKFAQKIKLKKKINLNNCIKNELPFTEKDILNILKIVDVALADEKIESEIHDWIGVIYEPIRTEELEELHKKVNFFLQDLK
jgi:hypothetical protein